MALAMRGRIEALVPSGAAAATTCTFGMGIAQGRYPGRHRLRGALDYGAIGSVSNLAARLCAEARPGEILISPSAVQGRSAHHLRAEGRAESQGIREARPRLTSWDFKTG